MALVKGTLDVLVLKALAWTPMHAFEIVSWLEDRSAGRVNVEDAALMQALHRLEERKLVAAEWGITENGRRARYYRPTAAGRAHLRAETKRLTDYVDALTSILSGRTVAD
ncbi:MAG TPA: helix-turn-helix transcriptional regulator [Gemmatimonadaceae bacterium]|jgi:PadR family transcriptional regulator|nr:helix-turn-helix transcriptional regulator [Gemmatimonadaceae bacterium]